MPLSRMPILTEYSGEGLVLADNGLAYRIRTNPLDCMREHFAYYFGAVLGVPTPRFDILLDPVSRHHVFGVQWQHAESMLNIDALRELVRGESGRALGSDALASLLAYDLWVHNDDRHARNLLIQRSPLGTQLLAIDFARARPDVVREEPQVLLDDRSNTVQFYRTLFQERGKLPRKPIEDMLARIESFDAASFIPVQIALAPVEWQRAARASEGCLDFWGDGRRQRLAAMRDWLDAFAGDLVVAA